MPSGTYNRSTQLLIAGLKRRVCIACGNVPTMDSDGNILVDGMCRKCFDNAAGWAEYNSSLKFHKWNFKTGVYDEVPEQKT